MTAMERMNEIGLETKGETGGVRRWSRSFVLAAALALGAGSSSAFGESVAPPEGYDAAAYGSRIAEAYAGQPQGGQPQGGGQPQTAQPSPAQPSAAPAPAAPVDGAKEANQRLDRWGADLDRIERGLKPDDADDGDLARLRDEIEVVRADLAAFLNELRPRLEAAEAQLSKLGPITPESAAVEPAAAAAERKTLTALKGNLSGARGVAEALQDRSRRLMENLQEKRRQLFTGGLLKRAPLFSYSLWREVALSASPAVGRLNGIVGTWWNDVGSRLAFVLILGGCLFAWGALSLVCRRAITHFRMLADPAPSEAPPLWRRAASAAWVILLSAAPTAFAAGGFFLGVTEFGLVTHAVEPMAYALALAVSVVAVVSALAATLLSPYDPRWRIFPVSDRAARRVYGLAIALAAVYGADLFLEALNSATQAPVALFIAKTFVTDALFGALMLAMLLTAKKGVDGSDARAPWLVLLRIPLWGAAVAILAATWTGHVALARFLAAQVVVTGVILVIVYLLLIWTDVLNHAIVEEDMPMGRKLRDAQFDQRRRRQIALPITLGLQAAVILAAIPLVLLQWGFDHRDVRDWFAKAFFGFQVGKIVISPATLIGALVVFAVGYLAAQFLRNWIDRQVLTPAGVTGGARDSIRTGVGYLGVSVAAILAFSYIGVDSSHIALVAGALSLGIGFGLQSIVNNFVSGLILLAERPIKVGDWIIVHGEEGFVRRISVRTTEIETFDRSHVILPNSMLISEKLKNWTLHNTMGRMTIVVGVSYDADPELVCSLLLKAARAHPRVLNWPEPFVYFKDFGPSAMDFELFVYLTDVKEQFSVRTDLRIAIWKAFREAGVEIPVNQHDVHVRDLDWIRRAIARQADAASENGASASAAVIRGPHGSAAHAGDGVKARDGAPAEVN